VTYGSIPTGFKDRTKDGGGIALIGGTGSPHSTQASNAKPGDTETSGAARTHSEQGSPSRLRFIDVAEAGEEPRFMGLIVLHPKKMDDEARYCRQVEQVQKIEAEAQARHATTQDDLFPIYAECGLTPDDFVPETAERFAEYLARANRMEA